MAVRKPSVRSRPEPLVAIPATAGSTAIASSCATRATELLIAEPMPAWWSSIAASTAAVSGATVVVSPTPSTSTPGSTPVA